MSGGWVGFDLDGTLCHHEAWNGINHFGEPIWPTINMLRELLARGITCKIVTARVAHGGTEADLAATAIHKWLARHGIRRIEVVCRKDFAMMFLIDDRCVAVEANTGVVLGGSKQALDMLGLEEIPIEVPASEGAIARLILPKKDTLYVPRKPEIKEIVT
jgi:hypothetical protein